MEDPILVEMDDALVEHVLDDLMGTLVAVSTGLVRLHLLPKGVERSELGSHIGLLGLLLLALLAALLLGAAPL